MGTQTDLHPLASYERQGSQPKLFFGTGATQLYTLSLTFPTHFCNVSDFQVKRIIQRGQRDGGLDLLTRFDKV